MRLKTLSSQEIVQNGNTFNTLDSLVDGNKNDQKRISTTIEDNVKWLPSWANEKTDSCKTENSNNIEVSSQPASPVEEEGEWEESSSCSVSDSEEDSERRGRGRTDETAESQGVRRSFANPNYPGFSHLAHELQVFDTNNNNSNEGESEASDPTEAERRQPPPPSPSPEPSQPTGRQRNDNFKHIDWVNKLEGCQVKEIYKKSKLDLGEVKESNMAVRASGKREKTEINNSLKRGKTKDPGKGDFDVYNIETAMPKIDLEAIESHLRAAREEERRRRNDREEIRRRLATGDNDDYYGGEKSGKKPSLQARLQSGMNLQICFMNETSSDTESPSSESSPAAPQSLPPMKIHKPPEPPKSLNLPSLGKTRNINSGPQSLRVGGDFGGDFFSRQARLQTEARLALAQAKDRARLQMEAERHRQQTSPITQMLRDSLNKVGIKFPEDRRRLSRQMLTDMNVAQLQVIVNDLHTQIEILNERLVKFLMERDELHMSQDSMLVDIEDITRYLVTISERCKGKQPERRND